MTPGPPHPVRAFVIGPKSLAVIALNLCTQFFQHPPIYYIHIYAPQLKISHD